MITIKLKLDKSEMESILKILLFTIGQLKPATLIELHSGECLQKTANKINNKMYAHSNKCTISLSLSEVWNLQAFGNNFYSKTGVYESAVWHRISTELQMKINREIQIRMT